MGDDISFDLALIDTIGCRVYAPDPTPNAIEWIKRQNVPSEFQFIPIGLSGSEGILDFHVPARKDLDCFSRTPVAGAKLTGVVQCPVTTIPQLMRQLNHDHIDLLKMDIEGFEYEVLDQMLCAGVRPMQIAVEFHHLQYGHSAQQTIGAVEGLKRAGYGLHWVSDRGNEYGFVLRSQLF
ncbi:FkbM family methyltransferase [Methylobacterium brachythecii]|uniref:FkbM family methyltransferase n=1 Tax=Methylobacterium brachythecii TaxID=1176177 RepID=UPI00160E4B9D